MNMGWIIEKLMRDVTAELIKRGFEVNIGDESQYEGEDVFFHSRYLYSNYIVGPKINSLFVTHIDDSGKEFEIKNKFRNFESFVCMSPSDASVLRALGCKAEKTIGINLPHRGGTFIPLRFAIFSACYKDGRKNEKWLVEYLRNNPGYAKDIIISLLGSEWQDYVLELKSLNVSAEWFNFSRNLIDEYELQKRELIKNDYLIYMGFDGGAMCLYDGIYSNLKLIFPRDGYHIGYRNDELYFNNKDDFFNVLDSVFGANAERKVFLESRNIVSYVDQLIHHWNAQLGVKTGVLDVDSSDFDSNELVKRRATYHGVTVRRFVSSMYRFFKSY
jgi:hypothetical protein